MEHNTRTSEIQAFKSMRLTESEKGSMLNALLSHIEKHPIKAVPLVRSPFYSRIWTDALLQRRASYAAFLVIIALVAGGGTVSAAEKALPGDLLYSVKINVNEPVRGAFTFNAAAQARWESSKAERRLQEAEALAAVGKLTKKVREEIQEQIQNNLAAFKTFATVAAQENGAEAADVHVNLQGKVTAHSKILERVQSQARTPEQLEVKKLELGVRQGVEDISSAPANTSATVPLTANEKDLTDLISKTRKVLTAEQNQPQAKLQTEILLDTHNALQTAESALGEAKAIKAEGDENSAYEAFIKSQRAAIEAATSLEQVFKLR